LQALISTKLSDFWTDTILSHVGPQVKTVMLGPTTPVIPDAFDHLPIHMLAGSFISDAELALRMIRHGGGARTLKQASRKVYCLTQAV
jgi:uncharacterized protein (DUF4213/DUF364 family)